MAGRLRVLVAEDRPADAELIIYELRRAGFEPDWTRVDNEKDYLERLDASLDLILADHSMPAFDSMRALSLLKERGLDVPFIVVTGSIGEEKAVEIIRQGASDYLLKDRLARLGEAAKRALTEKHLRDERRQAQLEIERHNRELALFNQVISAAASSLRIEEVLMVACRELAQALDVPQATASLMNKEGKSLEFLASYPPDHPLVGTTLVFEDDPVMNLLREKSAPVTVADVQNDVRLASAYGSVWRRDVGALLVFPLMISRNVIGAISLEASNPRVFSQAEMGLASSVAATLSQTVENVRLYEELENYSQYLAQAVEDRTAELREANERLKELDRLKDDFLSTATHELRTPLTSIRAFSELLLMRQFDDERQQHYLTLINDQSQHLAIIIDDLLSLSKLETRGRLAFQFDTFHIADLVHDMLLPIMDSSPDHHFRQENLDVLPPVRGDRFRLGQVLTNLLSNAVKYSPEGGEVLIQGREDSGMVEISVEDEGLGMTTEQQEHLFERFYRAHTSLNIRGTGLGLSICKLIVEGHGGKIWVESQPGAGSTFTFTAPVAGGDKSTDEKGAEN